MFRLPTHTLIAEGAALRASEFVPGSGRVLFVTDPGLLSTTWPSRVLKTLQATGRDVVVFDGIEPNPRTSAVNAAAESFRSAPGSHEAVDAIVALGGGSVIDGAKGIAVALRNPGAIEAYEGRNRFDEAPVPLVAIPTTCGTGSEVTWVSVLTHEAERRKISVKGDALFPAVALVDPDTLQSLPAHMIASTGMDAMTHAIEAYVSVVSNPASDALAERAVRMLLKHLPDLVEDPASASLARREVMTASTLAGMAFGNADVGAVHCLSEAIGGRHDLAHGLLNAVLLTPVLRSHGKSISGRMTRLGERAGSRNLMIDLEQVSERLRLPAFRELGVPASDYSGIAEAAEGNGSNGSNLRTMLSADYMAILESLR